MAYKNSCKTLKKIGDDEPMFVLRAQDHTAPAVVLEWIKLNPQISIEKRQEAFQCAQAMMLWPTRKSAD